VAGRRDPTDLKRVDSKGEVNNAKAYTDVPHRRTLHERYSSFGEIEGDQGDLLHFVRWRSTIPGSMGERNG
jgi:hypothetical protein